MTKAISSALEAHLALETTSIATCWRITRTDGVVFRFTTNTRDVGPVDFGIGEGAQTYIAAAGYTRSNIQNDSDLTVNNMDVTGIFDDASITELDLRRGLFNFAEVRIFTFNHQDTSMGILRDMRGILGEARVTPNGFFEVEIRSLEQVYTKGVAEFYSKDCRADLGDARCRLPIEPTAPVPRSTLLIVGDFFRAADALIFTPGADTVLLVNGDITADDLVLGATATIGASAALQSGTVKFGAQAIEFSPTGGDPEPSFVSYPDRAEYTIGTGQFTVEMWVNWKDAPAGDHALISQFTVAGNNKSWWFGKSGGDIRFIAWSNGSTTVSVDMQRAFTFTLGVWQHFAIARDASNDIRIFVDGVQIGATLNDAGSVFNGTSPLQLGRVTAAGFSDKPFDGFLDDIRFTVGSALYTANFTPPTELIAIPDPATLDCVDFNDRIYKVITAGITSGHPQPFYNTMLVPSFDFVDADVTVATDTIAETGHGMITGDGPGRLTTDGVLPVPLAIDTPYWVIRVDDDNFKIAASEADALANIPIDITSAAGGGTHTFNTDVIDGTAVLQAEESWTRCFTVSAVDGSEPRRKFTVTELTPVSGGPRGGFPADWFNFGGCTFETGLNAGKTMEARDFVEGASTQDIELFLPLPFDITIGDTGRIYPGCDKRFVTCRDKFDNVLNFVGEPYVPGTDYLLTYPDAR